MPSYAWTCVNDYAAFVPRDGAGLLAFEGRLWLLGGWNPSDKEHFPQICNSEIWCSEDGAEWDLVTHAPWEGRHTAGYAVHDGRMWIVGGDANQGHYQSDVWVSDDGERWEQILDDAPWGPRVLHHTVAFDGAIWLMGGQTVPHFAPAEERFYADVWRSEDGAFWERVADDLPWAPRGMIGGSSIFDGRIWLLGGGTYDTPDHPDRIFLNDVWASSDGVEWEQVADETPWAPRQYHEVAAWDGRLWVMEGYDGEANRKDVWHSPGGTHWQEMPDTPWLPRHAASVTVFEDALWVVAGNNMTPDVWRLDRA
jgi:hypothetical protein